MKRVAVVTGSSRGIGRAIADALWAEGYVVVYSGTGEKPPAGLPAERPYMPCDVVDASQRARLIDDTVAAFGRLDVFVSNAGVAPLERLDVLMTTEESFDRVLAVNLRGAFFLCQHAARAMLRLKETLGDGYNPRMLLVTSVSAYAASTNRAEYCIAKAGLSMVAQLFAQRLAGEGIPVFEIRPGIIATDMTSGVRTAYEGRIAEGLTPIPRMGCPEDVAKVALAACSGLLDFSAGQALDADGGFHLRRL